MKNSSTVAAETPTHPLLPCPVPGRTWKEPHALPWHVRTLVFMLEFLSSSSGMCSKESLMTALSGRFPERGAQKLERDLESLTHKGGIVEKIPAGNGSYFLQVPVRKAHGFLNSFSIPH